MKAARGKSIEPSVSKNEHFELRECRDGWGLRGGMREAGGQREGESFITVDGGSALRAAGAGGTLTFLSFH